MSDKTLYVYYDFEYKGVKRKLIIAGVVDVTSVNKSLRIGVSIQNPTDHNNDELGKKIAEGRAKKKPIYKTRYCLGEVIRAVGVYDTIIKAILKATAREIELNPHKHMPFLDRAIKKLKERDKPHIIMGNQVYQQPLTEDAAIKEITKK